MKISFESELMKNRKHATVLAPDRAFEVLQTAGGDAIFFSIGMDGVFYVTRELNQTATGWNRTDLSTSLSASHGSGAVTAKSFAVGQSADTRAVDMALVVTAGGQDFLYLSLGNGTTDAGWASPVGWTAVPFDAGTVGTGTGPAPLTIADVYLENIGGTETIFADVVRRPGDPLQLLDRYYITPGGAQRWNPHHLAVDLAAGSIKSCLGQRSDDPVPGIYTFGTIGGTPELIFTPQYNYFRPAAAPSPARLTLPAESSAIAAAVNAAGTSNLFVAAGGGLYVFTPDNQHDGSAPVQVFAGGAFTGATRLAAATDGGRTAVWGISPQGQLCYAVCAAGSEGNPAAWSHPVPLLPAAEQFAFFLNLGAGSNVLFASTSGTELTRLSQDPVTGGWSQRSILLPPTAPGDVVEQDTYTTHVQVTDDNQIPVPDAALTLTGTSPVSVYLNDVYYQLSPDVGVQVTADATGVLTVVQETTTVAAACFQVTVTGPSAVTAEINPMSKAQAILATVKSGDDLAAVQVTNSDGTAQPLVPATVQAGDRDAAASAIGQLATISGGLPSNGSRQLPAAAGAAAARAAAGVPRVWGVSFTGGGLAYYEGESAGRFAARTAAPEDLGSDIAVAAGDLFRWLGQAAADVAGFVVQEAEGLYHFVVTIAGQVYRALLDCYDAVVRAVEYVLSKIEVFFEDLVKWLGFIFQWADIVRTHQVLRNIFRQYTAKCLTSVADSRNQVTQYFTEVQNFLASWAGIPASIPADLTGATAAGATASATPPPGAGSPQSNFGIQQLKSNAVNGSVGNYAGDLTSDMQASLSALEDAVSRELEVIQAALGSIKTNIIDKYNDLTTGQIIEAFVAILGDALLQSVENVLLAAIDFLAAVGNTFLDILDAAIDVPVLSALYKEISGDDLTMLDVICLVMAIPATIGFKLVGGAPPFPDNAMTTALINAPDWNAIRQAYSTPPPSARAAGPLAASPRTDFNDSMDPANKALALVGGLIALYGATIESHIAGLAKKYPDAVFPPVLTAVFYIPYNMPTYIGDLSDVPKIVEKEKWYLLFNLLLTDLGVCKAIADAVTAFKPNEMWKKASPYVDLVSSVIWMVPTIGPIFDEQPETKYGTAITLMNVLGGTFFNFSGMLSPAIEKAEDPESLAILLVSAGTCNIIYGILAAVAGGLIFADQTTS
jgi:hypothetical protein